MGAYLDIAAMTAALKELYAGQVVENLVYRNNPFLALVPKDTGFVGKYLPQPIITGASQGRSSTFSTAQANQSPVQIQEFLVTRRSDYSIATIDNQTMLASATDQGSFLRGAKTAIDGAFKSITLSLTQSLFRTGTGSIGQLSTAGVNGGVITLLNVNDIVNFEVNQVLQCTTGAVDGNAPRAALGYVTAVARDTGIVTVSATGFGGATGAPAGWAASEFLLVQGDSNLKMSGLGAWLPSTTPAAADNFYGVNRSVDPVRLAGLRYNGAAQSIEEALIDASQLLGREDGMPDYAFMSFGSYTALVKGLSSKVQYFDLKQGEIAFRGVEINGANTKIRVLPDRSCPPALAYMLQLDTWKLHSLGEAPQILRYLDSNEFLRVGTADAAELRVGYYGSLICAAPGFNATVTLAQ